MGTISGIVRGANGAPVAGRIVRAYRRDNGALIGEGVTSDGTIYTPTISGQVAGLDAKLYSSGQTWTNSVASPADGVSPTAYDFFLGSTNSAEALDPTITGTGTDSAYFSFDGGDYFTHSLAAASMPNFLRTMHQASKAFTIEVWMQWSGTAGTNVNPLFDSGTGDFGGSDMSRGVIFGDLGNLGQTAGRIGLRIKADAGGANAFAVQSDETIPSGSVQMLAVSYTANDSSFFYRNGNYSPVSSSNTFTATLTSPSTNPAANPSKIGARGDGGFRVPTGTRIYLIRIYNRALSKTELDSNWNSTKSRFGLGIPGNLSLGQYSLNIESFSGDSMVVVLSDVNTKNSQIADWITPT